MKWKEKYIWIIIESIICSIPMMNIKVNYKHTLQSMNTLRITGCNGHISKNAESHRSLWNCVMSWWSYQSKTSGCISLYLWTCNLNMKLNRRNLYPTQKYIPSSLYFLKHLCPKPTILKALTILVGGLGFLYLWKTPHARANLKHRQWTWWAPCAEIQLNYEE